MTKEELYLIALDAVNNPELKSGDIPAIDLYIDQILNLVKAKSDEGSDRYKDNHLTKTMVNNYSKDGVIIPVKGKKYTKEQILQILTVYSLKNSISIGEIKRLLDGAYAIDGFDGHSLELLYDRYQDIRRQNVNFSGKVMESIMSDNSLDVADDTDYIVTVCALISLSAQLKNIARAMIDEKYPEPVQIDEEKDKKEEKKDKKDKKKKDEDQ